MPCLNFWALTYPTDGQLQRADEVTSLNGNSAGVRGISLVGRGEILDRRLFLSTVELLGFDHEIHEWSEIAQGFGAFHSADEEGNRQTRRDLRPSIGFIDCRIVGTRSQNLRMGGNSAGFRGISLVGRRRQSSDEVTSLPE